VAHLYFDNFVIILELNMLFVTEFEFEVGEKEKHEINFKYSKWLGDITIKSDGVVIAKNRVLLAGQSPIINVSVGNSEKHNLRFDVRPQGLFFLKPTIAVYVDDKLFKDY